MSVQALVPLDRTDEESIEDLVLRVDEMLQWSEHADSKEQMFET